MPKKSPCQYSGLCDKQEWYLPRKQRKIMYWPRDPSLEPLCMDKGESEDRCLIWKYWKNNPELRKKTGRLSPVPLFPKIVLTVLGAELVILSPENPSMVGAGTFGFLMGAYMTADHYLRRYLKKSFFEWFDTRKERDGTEEAYQKMLDMTNKAEGSDPFWPKAADRFLLGNISNISEIKETDTESDSRERDSVKFKAGKLSVYYNLTSDFETPIQQNIGVALSLPYKTFCPAPDCEGHSGSVYTTGLIMPKIKKRRLEKDGLGFMAVIEEGAVPVSINISNIGIGITTATRTKNAYIAPTKDLFGTTKVVDNLEKEMPRLGREARVLHGLVQELLYETEF